MAYNFNGTADQVQFGVGALNGYAIGPVTFAILLRRTTVSAGSPQVAGLDGSAVGARQSWHGLGVTNRVSFTCGTAGSVTNPAAQTLGSTSVWYLNVMTWAGAGTTPRFHLWNGTSWAHGPATAAMTPNASAVAAGDKVRVGTVGGSNFLAADVVCYGIKKADTASDAAVEAISPVSFPAWLSFGFDWLIGFQAAGPLTNRAPGGGNETSRTGTTLVPDPPYWNWAPVTPTVIVASGGGISLYGLSIATAPYTYEQVHATYTTYAAMLAAVGTYNMLY